MPGVLDWQPLPPEEAIKFFRRKTVGARFTYDWRDMWQAEHAAAFVVAKVMRADILKIIHTGLEQALKEGLTARQFADQVRPLLIKKGWWGFKRVYDPLTGTRKVARLGTPRRLNLIYDVNLRMARAAGRWERIERAKNSRPYLLYRDARDGRVRPAHRAMHGILLPVDHPFWKTYYPPNGWRCRCIVRQVTGGYIRKNGLSISSEGDIRTAGYGQTVPWLNKRTGKTMRIPKGVSPGFGYNVGRARLRALTPSPDGGPIGSFGGTSGAGAAPGGISLPPLPLRPAKSALLPEDISHEEAIAAFLAEFDGPVFIDPAQGRIMISRRFFIRDDGRLKNDARIRKQSVLIFADTIKDPDEIWVEIVTVRGKVKMKRRALARWQLPDSTQTVMAVFEELDNGTWRGATVYAGGRKHDASQIKFALEKVRVGTLIYRRPVA